MKLLKGSESGFGIIEILLIVVVLGLIGVSGYFVTRHFDSKTKSPTSSTSQSASVITLTDSCTLIQPQTGIKVTPESSSSPCTVYLKPGDIFVLDAPQIKYSDGTYGAPSNATSGNPAVLSSIANPSDSGCGHGDICSAFKANSSGTSTLSWSNPGGCHSGICITSRLGATKVIVN